ncbi:hypothetical protein GQ44DRAFT_757630 [Phaeosphaeriaceae sp. PMI808]|nr:hypothetical protein GQ44DRAFT_757630 [Phaeosphaeriaceae sp. PMI808]
MDYSTEGGQSMPERLQGHSLNGLTPALSPALSSAILGAESREQTPKLILKLRVPSVALAPSIGIVGSDKRNQEWRADGAITGESRAGRRLKLRKQNDSYLGSDFDDDVDKGSVQTNDLLNEAKHQNLPEILMLQHQTRNESHRPGRSPRNLIAPFGGDVDEGSSSDTLQPTSPPHGHLNYPPQLEIDPTLYTLLNSFKQSSKIAVDLPVLSYTCSLDKEKPYTAKDLMHLYLISYENAEWNLCDVIVDTWIRAFHNLRKKAKRDEKYQIWLPNTALEQRMRERRPFDDSAPDYKLDVEDPNLHPDVTRFDHDLLRELYDHTPSNCGARLVWADSMALAGDAMERLLIRNKRAGIEWHEDLLYDIMCTSLRMLRRKLTLKNEETTEGAWCKRYHEHTKHGLKCYRRLAWERKQSGEDDSDEEGDQDYAAHDEVGRGQKRGYGGIEDDGDIDMPDAKRVHFSTGPQDIIDVDAEGETDDD